MDTSLCRQHGVSRWPIIRGFHLRGGESEGGSSDALALLRHYPAHRLRVQHQRTAAGYFELALLQLVFNIISVFSSAPYRYITAI